MRLADGDDGAFLRMLREQAQRDAAELVPRPGCHLYGLATPRLHPVALSEVQRQGLHGNPMRWTLITLTYGDRAASPWVSVTSSVVSPGAESVPAGSRSSGAGSLGRLLDALEFDRHGGGQTPDGVQASRERLPAGNALVVRDGPLWAARMLPGLPPTAETSIPVMAGHGVSPADVHLEHLPDLRSVLGAQLQAMEQRMARGRTPLSPPPAPPGFEPAEGVAALRALVDVTLANSAATRAAARDRRPPPREDPPGLYGALWRQAAREQQRLSGTSAPVADAVVTSAVNQLGHLQEQAAWFTADDRLRAAAIDETLRHAMSGDTVPSGPAQRAWAGYWAAHLHGAGLPGAGRQGAGPPGEPDSARARHEAGRANAAGWLAAWQDWADRA